MMHSESNPLIRELANTQPLGPHPDADVLVAFAEGALLNRERTDVLQHLAVCAECRKIVNMSVDAAPEVLIERKVTSSPAALGYRQWMPWVAGFAASLLVLTVITVVHRNSSKSDSAGKLDYIARVDQPPAPARGQVRPTPQEEAPEKKATTRPAEVHQRNSILRKEDSRGRQAELPDSLQTRSVSAAGFAPALPESQSTAKDLQLAKTPGIQQESQAGQVALGAAMTQPALAPAPAPPASPSTAELAREGNLHGEPAQKSARSEAKPSFMAGAISSNAAVAGISVLFHWRISPAGRVERQTGTGPWEAMLPLEPATMRVVTVYGRTVWTGGDSQRLYRSADDGATWTAVVLPDKGGARYSIAHIRFTNSDAGTVEAADGTQWTTTDGGLTWQ